MGFAAVALFAVGPVFVVVCDFAAGEDECVVLGADACCAVTLDTAIKPQAKAVSRWVEGFRILVLSHTRCSVFLSFELANLLR